MRPEPIAVFVRHYPLVPAFASATPWALDSDATLSGLLQRGLACFAYDQGCGRELFLPAILKLP